MTLFDRYRELDLLFKGETADVRDTTTAPQMVSALLELGGEAIVMATAIRPDEVTRIRTGMAMLQQHPEVPDASRAVTLMTAILSGEHLHDGGDQSLFSFAIKEAAQGTASSTVKYLSGAEWVAYVLGTLGLIGGVALCLITRLDTTGVAVHPYVIPGLILIAASLFWGVLMVTLVKAFRLFGVWTLSELRGGRGPG